MMIKKMVFCVSLLFMSGCCEVISAFTGGECLTQQEFNSKYIDQDNKLKTEQLQREFKQSEERKPIPAGVNSPMSLPDDWRPWEQQQKQRTSRDSTSP
jgi:hypothetical protein